jgi:hypothetical protein
MLTNCALEEHRVVRDLDGVKSVFYLYAVMETINDFPTTSETDQLVRIARERLMTRVKESGLDEVTLSRLLETFNRRPNYQDP